MKDASKVLKAENAKISRANNQIRIALYTKTELNEIVSYINSKC